jgi:hypothetical protein
MDSSTLDRLTQRLDRLERENRRWRLAGCLSVLGLVAVALMGQAIRGKVAKVVEAERFVLRDSSGIERAALDILPGGAALSLLDQNGAPRALLSQEAIGFLSDGSRAHVALAMLPGGRPLMDFAGPTGNVRVQLGIQKDGRV